MTFAVVYYGTTLMETNQFIVDFILYIPVLLFLTIMFKKVLLRKKSQ